MTEEERVAKVIECVDKEMTELDFDLQRKTIYAGVDDVLLQMSKDKIFIDHEKVIEAIAKREVGRIAIESWLS